MNILKSFFIAFFLIYSSNNKAVSLSVSGYEQSVSGYEQLVLPKNRSDYISWYSTIHNKKHSEWAQKNRNEYQEIIISNNKALTSKINDYLFNKKIPEEYPYAIYHKNFEDEFNIQKTIDKEQIENNNLIIAIIKNKEIVSNAIFKTIEPLTYLNQVDTLENHRKKGLMSICIKEGLKICFDIFHVENIKLNNISGIQNLYKPFGFENGKEIQQFQTLSKECYYKYN